MTEPGWYEYEHGQMRWWDGEKWGGFADRAQEFAATHEPAQPSRPDLSKWEQDPDGNWHRRPDPPDRSNLAIAIVFVLTLLAAGGIGWKWKQDHDEAERRREHLTCVMSGGRYCDDEPRRP